MLHPLQRRDHPAGYQPVIQTLEGHKLLAQRLDQGRLIRFYQQQISIDLLHNAFK